MQLEIGLLGNLLNSNRTNKNNSIRKLIINNKELSNNKDNANALNTHFRTIGKNLANKVIPKKKIFLNLPDRPNQM